jgi:hypothetical protein
MSMNEKKRKREDTESEEDFHAKSLRRGGAWNGPGMGKHGVPNVRRTAPERGNRGRGRRPGRRGRDRNGSGRVSMGGGGRGANEEEEDGVGEEEDEEDEDEEMEDEEVEDQDKIVAGEKTKKSKGKEQRK